MTRTLRRTAAALVAAGLLAAACGNDDSTDAATTGQPADGSSAETTDVTVTLVTHDSFAISDATLDEFTAETGVEVRLLQGGDAGAALNQLILTKSSPEGDVFFGVDNTFLSRALDEDIFVPHEAEGLDDVDPDLLLDPEFRVTPIDTGDVCLNYDKAAFDDAAGLAPPADLDDLVDPAYADLTVVQNPATSSPGLAFLLATVAEYGEDGWEDWWQRLVDNGVEVTSGWEDAYYGSFSGSGGSEGTKPIVVSYASSPPAEVIFAAEPLDDAPTASVVASCFRQIEFAGIVAGTDHPDEAGMLIDFMLGDTFQEDIPLNMFVFPVRDVDLPAEFVQYAQRADDPLSLDPAVIAQHRDEWIERWTDIVLR